MQKRDNKGRSCKSTERKYIILGEACIEDEVIKVVIEAQSHKAEEFGKEGYEFKASNGYTLKSVTCPCVSLVTGDDTTYVQGNRYFEDHDPLEFESLNEYNKFVAAVNEYNEYFSKPRVKEMTLEEVCKELGYEVKIKKED